MSQSSPAGTGSAGKPGISSGLGKATQVTFLTLPGVAVAWTKLASEAVHFHRPLLRARLHDPIIFSRRTHERPPFTDRERQRLLAIDIFARLTREHAGQHMVRVGRTDDHRVDIFAVDQFAVVLHDVKFGREPFGGRLRLRLIAIAHGDELSAGRHVVAMLIAARPHADDPHGDAVVGAGRADRRQSAAGHEARRGGRCYCGAERSLQELPTLQLRRYFFFHDRNSEKRRVGQ